jgi:DNA-binding IclR family transcriptional regulator
MDEHESGTGRRVQAVELSCEILEALRRLDGAGVSELAAELGRSKAAVHGHLRTLLDNEFVVRRDDEYTISLRFADFGAYAKTELDIYDVAGTQVDRLADTTGEVAQFMVEEHGRGVYLHKARGENAIQTASYIGNRKDLHCTALGKAILSQLPTDRVDAIVERTGLPAHTENTLSTRAELLDELEEIREANVAFDDEEILQGMRCVAAPVRHPAGTLHGAISVSGPTSRFTDERLREELAVLVQDAANVIEVNVAQA